MERGGVCRGGGREVDRGGPSLGSPIASELANTIIIHLHPHLPPHHPLRFLGNQPIDWSAPELDREGRWVWEARKRGAGLKSPSPRT